MKQSQGGTEKQEGFENLGILQMKTIATGI